MFGTHCKNDCNQKTFLNVCYDTNVASEHYPLNMHTTMLYCINRGNVI